MNTMRFAITDKKMRLQGNYGPIAHTPSSISQKDT